VLLSGLMIAMIAGATLAMSPSIVARTLPATQTALPIAWAAANIAKPTYTPSPVPTATFTATAEPTEAPTQSALQAVIVPTDAAAAQDSQPAPDTSSTGQYILVSISQQHMWAYQDSQLLYSFVVSTGIHNGTRTGKFSVLDKIPNAYGATWNIWMPNWMGIYYAGTLENGIHALPILPDGNRLWAGFLGTPISYGCVVLGTNEAQQLYDWALVGTPVEIQW